MPDSPAPSTRTGRVHRLRRTLLWSAVGLAVAVTATSGWLNHHISGKITSVDIHADLGGDRPPQAKDTASGGQNILVLGNDSKAPSDGAQESLTGIGSALVVHLPDSGTPTAVSIPPAMPVARPDCAEPPAAEPALPVPVPGGENAGTAPAESGRAKSEAAAESGEVAELPFQEVHPAGGPSCVVRVVEQLSGVRVDHYIEVDFAGFGKLVDALDGITVTTEEPIQDPRTGLELPAGAHALDGSEAMAALRAAPAETQQRFLLALIDEINQQDVLGSPAKLYRVADAAARSLTTDSSLGSLTGLVSFARDLGSADTGGMRISSLPADPEKAEPVWQTMRGPAADG